MEGLQVEAREFRNCGAMSEASPAYEESRKAGIRPERPRVKRLAPFERETNFNKDL